MTRIIETGGNGFLASLVRVTNREKFDFVPIGRSDVDLSDPQAVRVYFEGQRFDAVFHTAAVATTALCEGNPELTHRINAESAIEIAKVCKERGARLVFCSTEQIYNGKVARGPFPEEEPAESVTQYGIQKAEVDSWISENLDNYVTLRLSTMLGMAMPGVRPSANPIYNMLAAMRGRRETLFTVNEHRGFTYARRLADQFGKILELPSGTYNFSSCNDESTYDMTRYVAERFGFPRDEIDAYVKPNYERYSDRFRDYRLDSSKIRAAGIDLGTSKDDFDQCLRDFGWLA